MTQPHLHELVTCVAAPTVVLSAADGQIRGDGAQGVLRSDLRLLSTLVVELDGVEPEAVGHALGDAATCTFAAIVPHLGDTGVDPTVRLTRVRTATSTGMLERLELANHSHVAVRTRLTVRLGCDLAVIGDIKAGRETPPVAPRPAEADAVRWEGAHAVVDAAVEPPPSHADLAAGGAVLAWDVHLEPRGRWTAAVHVTAAATATGRLLPAPTRPWSTARVPAGDRDLARLVDRSLADLAGLALIEQRPDRDGAEPDVFLGAGCPWFLTLFGRDSLWSARLLLPLGTTLAHGTLRTLARHQGVRSDLGTGESPGKIIHEVREAHARIGLPARYYGSVDATALWVCTLHDAWRWGLPEHHVRDLLHPLRAALAWLTGPADPDGDGFLEYVDVTGAGLANQGWKDSGDAIQWPDGRIAEPPIALSEAQAYAYEAAIDGAALLDAVGDGGEDRSTAGRLHVWAASLRDRFRAAFWVRDERGRFPAIALDRAKRPVATLASNVGHLLGTGLLDEGEAADVAARLAGPELDCGYGLRTMSAAVAGANPLGYHTGSVWPHDTAIAVRGLVAEGHGDVAARLAGGLLRAAPAFSHRIPELFGGTDHRRGEPVVAYPAACRPQAWSACAAVTMLTAALGLAADVPAGELHVRPHPGFADWFPLRVTGLRVAGHPLDVAVDATGPVRVATAAPLTVRAGEDTYTLR